MTYFEELRKQLNSLSSLPDEARKKYGQNMDRCMLAETWPPMTWRQNIYRQFSPYMKYFAYINIHYIK